ncbi:helix-turn-helix transcriptional regulator [uncultured Gemella sp.]|uniref:helix-turn-helix domain-containing protein n=1 Tax=uncultured Gemella sp. TaxID=254352 RepID=UPI0028D7DCC2|nr:helix-turn-helix transcriptional regulator [uncultured Gemella sp.]
MKYNINKLKVSERIFRIRNSLKLTLEQFGKLDNLNASKSIVLRWENGTSLPNRSRLEIIAKKGNITVNELLYGSIDEFLENNLENFILNNSNIATDFLCFDFLEITKKYLKSKSKTINDISDIINLLEKDFDKILDYALDDYIQSNLFLLEKYNHLVLNILDDEPALKHAIYDISKDDTSKLSIYQNVLLDENIPYNFTELPKDFDYYKALLSILKGDNISNKYQILPFFTDLIDTIKYRLRLTYSNDKMYQEIQDTIEKVLENNGVFEIPYKEAVINNLTTAIIDKVIEITEANN